MLVTVALAVALGAMTWQLRRRYLVITVVGHSMRPTLRHGQKLLARRWRPGGASYDRLRRSEIIVFVPPAAVGFKRNLTYRVKRVVAIAGDPAPSWLPVLPGIPVLERVPPGTVVVRGDNPRSEDSRNYGWVAETSILGLVATAGSPVATEPRHT